MKWQIAKQFDFCYGHRVWSQQLNAEYSLDSCLKCRHLHGHQGTIHIYLESNKLQEGMVTDFKHLNWFKKWLDDTLDHKFIMDWNDPMREYMFMDSISYQLKYKEFKEGYKIIDINDIPKSCKSEMIEYYEGMVFVNFVPTSENLSKWIFDIVQEKMSKIGVIVQRVQFFETPKSQSNYIN